MAGPRTGHAKGTCAEGWPPAGCQPIWRVRLPFPAQSAFDEYQGGQPKGKTMEHELTHVDHNLRRIARESAELPGLRTLAKALYKWMYSRPNRNGNDYYGAFDSRAQALAAAPAMPTTYDQPSAGNMYLDRHKRINCSDYPMVYWLS